MSAKMKRGSHRVRRPAGARTIPDRLYERRQGDGPPRYYLDTRDLDGRRTPLCLPNQTRATTDYALALQLAEIRVRDAEEAQRAGEAHALQSRLLGLDPNATLGAFADRHLEAERLAGRWSASWLDCAGRMLRRAVVFFDLVQAQSDPKAWAARKIPDGPRHLASISTPDVGAFLNWLSSQRSARGGYLSASSRRHHLTVLSRMFRRAVSEGYATRNPCSDLLDRPQTPPSSTKLLDIPEVALILEAARRYQELNGGFVHAALAVLAYAGLRWGEVCNLEIDEVRRGLGLGVLDVTADADRSVKTAGSVRRIPLAPELARIFEEHCRHVPRLTGPLFANVRADGMVERMTDLRGSFDTIGRALGMPAKSVRAKRFRVAYATYRASCDGVSVVDLQHEMGHASLDMLAGVYARARMTRVRMGDHLDFSGARWLSEEDLAPLANIRARSDHPNEERRELVLAFLSAIEGLGSKTAAKVTNVQVSAVKRLRAGKASPEKIKGKTEAAMRAFLSSQRREVRKAA